MVVVGGKVWRSLVSTRARPFIESRQVRGVSRSGKRTIGTAAQAKRGKWSGTEKSTPGRSF